MRHPAGGAPAGCLRKAEHLVDLATRALEWLGEEVEEVALFSGGVDRGVEDRLNKAGVGLAKQRVAVNLHAFLGRGVGENVAVGQRCFHRQADDLGDAGFGHDLCGIVTVDDETDLAGETDIAQALGLAEGEVNRSEFLRTDKVDAPGFGDGLDGVEVEGTREVYAGDVVGASDEIEKLVGAAGLKRRSVGVSGENVETVAVGDEA